ncbi:MAG: NAD-dependent epimerase/dehydratase family protein [Tannerellaceae bacterium]|jgi:nucleoside-diphosphate-sugar epimerase|nr:NAD-dependent epimerase/dehydratase family protein [Tannerellaceae bacterium]
MKILISGATGFIGKNLSIALTEKHEIHVLGRSSSNISDFNHVFYFENNISELHDYLEKHQIAGIIHLASLFLSSHKNTDIENLIESNILLGTSLLEAAQNTSIRWFLNAGTFWQHYDFNSKNYNPVNLYAATKQAFIDLAKYYTETSDIKFVTLKICDTFGSGDTRLKIFNLWNKISETGETLVMSPGEQYIDMLYIDDVVDGFVRLVHLLNSDEKLEADYALYAETRYKLKELSVLYQNATGKKLNIQWGKREYRTREVMEPWKMGNRLPEWKAKVSMEDGILKTMGLCME